MNPALFDKNDLTNSSLPQFYQGGIDGSIPDGTIINSGSTGDYITPPKVAADPDRRPLQRGHLQPNQEGMPLPPSR